MNAKEGGFFMFKNEVNYRIAKIILTNICHYGVLDKKEAELVCNELLKHYNPEFKSAEDTSDIKADGELVGATTKNRRRKIYSDNGDENV